MLEPYVGKEVSRSILEDLVKKINPTITTHEQNTLFNYLNIGDKGCVDWKIIN
jgi:hypothetical protein